MANDPKKPQGGKGGGKFVDPLGKWIDDLPSFKDLESETSGGTKNKKTKGKSDPERGLQDILVKDVDKAVDKIAMLIKMQSSVGLTRSERYRVQQELARARKAFDEVNKAANKVADELKANRRLEAEAYAKLNRIKTFRAQKGHEAGYDQDTILALKQTEESLEQFLKAMKVFGTGKNSEDEDVRKHMVASMDKLLDRVWSLPDEFQEAFKKDDSRLEQILKNQAEAKQFVQKQNEALAKFAMRVADRVGIGSFNLGNLIRGGKAVYNFGKAVANAPRVAMQKFRDIKDRIGQGRQFISHSMEMRRMAKADPDELMSVDGDQASTLKDYVSSTERFQRRLLDKIGRKKSGQQKNGQPDDGLLKGFTDLFGAGGFIKKLLSAAAALTGVAIAGAIGYWVGTKIWEKIAPWVQDLNDKLSGNDAVGKLITSPVTLNTQDNFARAKSIHDALKTPGSKVTGADQDFYRQFNFSNQNVDLDKPYAPSAGIQKINQQTQKTTGDFSRLDRQTGAAIATTNPISTKAYSTNSKVSDWVGKTISKSGDVDVDGLNPSMQANLIKMSQEYYEKTGKKLQLNSAFRSPEKQAELFRTMPPGMAAKPGSSLHNFGLAFDVQSAQANELQNLGLLDKYGFNRPIKKEPWHVQPVGMTVAAAKAGIYSADGPAHQDGNVASAVPQSQSVASAEPRIPVSGGADASTPGAGGGGGGGILSGGSKNSASDIPTFDTSDGMLMAMNIGALGT